MRTADISNRRYSLLKMTIMVIVSKTRSSKLLKLCVNHFVQRKTAYFGCKLHFQAEIVTHIRALIHQRQWINHRLNKSFSAQSEFSLLQFSLSLSIFLTLSISLWLTLSDNLFLSSLFSTFLPPYLSIKSFSFLVFFFFSQKLPLSGSTVFDIFL